MYRGRFAPSPTGPLHLGSAATALVAAARARAVGGVLVLREEDIDTPRVVAGAAAGIRDDLRWLGVRWDEGPDVGGAFGPYEQSKRFPLYAAAIDALAAAGHVYLCDCSRAEISAHARLASAPHAGEEGPRYPGTCRPHGMRSRAFKRDPAVRLAVPADARIAFVDGVAGPVEQDVAREVGDFVLRRGDGVFSYQLAVVVDDLAMGITEVVRGRDLLTSTARQILLARLLGGDPPSFAHVPLVTGPGGERLAKRAPGVTLREQRDAGRTGQDVARAIASEFGLSIDPGADVVDALAARLDLRALDGRALDSAAIVHIAART